MKLFCLQVPLSTRFAETDNLYVDHPVFTCSKCRKTSFSPPDYVELEWVEGSEEIADFVFNVEQIISRSSVADELLERFRGFSKGEVRMPDHPKLRRPTRPAKRLPKRVWLPYQGPELCTMRITQEAPLDDKSTVEVESHCAACGMIKYGEFPEIRQLLGPQRLPRERDKGFFFKQRLLRDADFFRPKDTGYPLCTERARNFMIGKGYTNIDLIEVGETG